MLDYSWRGIERERMRNELRAYEAERAGVRNRRLAVFFGVVIVAVSVGFVVYSWPPAYEMYRPVCRGDTNHLKTLSKPKGAKSIKILALNEKTVRRFELGLAESLVAQRPDEARFIVCVASDQFPRANYQQVDKTRVAINPVFHEQVWTITAYDLENVDQIRQRSFYGSAAPDRLTTDGATRQVTGTEPRREDVVQWLSVVLPIHP